MKAEYFLTAEQQETVVAAVKQAEKGTSGEIRIHIDEDCEVNPVIRAEEVFFNLGMHKTELRNGVLIYLACNSKVFAIIGDKGINDIVPESFWNDVACCMSSHFRKGDFAGGLSQATVMVGEKLKDYFPYLDNYINELSDEISF